MDEAPSAIAVDELPDTVASDQLEQQILSACFEQRRKIGLELHDDLGQRLTAVAFLAAFLARDLARTNSPSAKDAFKMEKLLGDAVSQIRLLARGLFPAALEDGGLLGALERLAEDARAAYRIECRVLWHASASREDSSVALHLYRICQEALSNAVRHGKASRVTIELFCDETKIAATITDNGVGFDARNVRRGQGIGLRMMRHRCKVMGLGFRVARIRDGGTIVSIGD